LADNDLREGDVGSTYTCAICCEVIYSWRPDWLTLRVTSTRSPATQELFVHKKCIIQSIGQCVPLGEVFE
jgi:hypothetical protein